MAKRKNSEDNSEKSLKKGVDYPDYFVGSTDTFMGDFLKGSVESFATLAYLKHYEEKIVSD